MDALIEAITTIDIQVVEKLLTESISSTTIYLVPKTSTEEDNVYDEYLYINEKWEHIGSTQVDLSNYVKKTEYDSKINELVTALENKADKNEWKLFATYEASGEDGGFLYKLDSLDVDEVRIIGKGLTFSQTCNLNFSFRSKKIPQHQVI